MPQHPKVPTVLPEHPIADGRAPELIYKTRIIGENEELAIEDPLG